MDQVRGYWDDYATRLDIAGAQWGSQEFFAGVKKDHDKAYALSNGILNIPAHKGKSVLDIYCGIGIDALELAKRGAEVTFISPSPNCVALTRKYFACHGFDAVLKAENIEELSFQENTFDVVIARSILMFTPHPERVMDEIYRVLKPGGEVYAHLHNRYSWYVFLAKLSRTNLIHEAKDPPINRLHSVEDAKKMFAKFSSISVFLDRFPSETGKRSGIFAQLYNRIFVPFIKVIPHALIRPFGFYIIVRAVKSC